MSTARIAFVRGVIAASTAAGSRLRVFRSTSAKTGVAPSYSTQLEEATKEKGVVTTSSPGPMPARRTQRWSPAVPLETAAVWGAPTCSASAASKRSIIGPRERRPERSTSRTSSSSRPSIQGAESGISRAKLGAGSGRRLLGVLDPAGPARVTPTDGVEVGRLDPLRHRPGRADLVVVHRTHRRHPGGGAAHEDFVGEIELRADDLPLLHGVPECLCDLDHRLARDPGQDRGREVRRREDLVLDDEDVLARAVRDRALVREKDRLLVAGPGRLDHGEHRVQVDPGRLRDVRDRVRPDPLPRGDLRAHAALEGVLAEICPPRPADDADVDRVGARVDAELAVAVEGERAQVALGQPVRRDELVGRAPQLLDRVSKLHVQEPCRVVEAHEVVGEAEYRRPVVGLVAADPLEDAGAVMEPVSGDVNLGVGPVHELAVHPDLLGLAHVPTLKVTGSLRRHGISTTASTGLARESRTRSAGARPALWRSEPAPIQTSSWARRLLSIRTVSMRGSGNGATPPAGKPVASATASGAADLTRRQPAARPTLPASARLSPGTMTTIARPSQEKTSDLTIWLSGAPVAREASSAVGVPSANSSTRASTLASRSTRTTRSTASGHWAISSRPGESRRALQLDEARLHEAGLRAQALEELGRDRAVDRERHERLRLRPVAGDGHVGDVHVRLPEQRSQAADHPRPVVVDDEQHQRVEPDLDLVSQCPHEPGLVVPADRRPGNGLLLPSGHRRDHHEARE